MKVIDVQKCETGHDLIVEMDEWAKPNTYIYVFVGRGGEIEIDGVASVFLNQKEKLDLIELVQSSVAKGLL